MTVKFTEVHSQGIKGPKSVYVYVCVYVRLCLIITLFQEKYKRCYLIQELQKERDRHRNGERRRRKKKGTESRVALHASRLFATLLPILNSTNRNRYGSGHNKVERCRYVSQ